MNNAIELGDWVQVIFLPMTNDLFGEVLYIPCATGDCWHIRGSDGALHYVQTFQKITRLDGKPVISG